MLGFWGCDPPVIDRIYPLAEAAEAQLRLENREQMGKVLLQIPETTERERAAVGPRGVVPPLDEVLQARRCKKSRYISGTPSVSDRV
jgi:hypothetical protein